MNVSYRRHIGTLINKLSHLNNSVIVSNVPYIMYEYVYEAYVKLIFYIIQNCEVYSFDICLVASWSRVNLKIIPFFPEVPLLYRNIIIKK